MTPILDEEKFQTKMELEEMPDGSWQVREIKIYTYDSPLAARNKIENYMYKKMDELKKKKELDEIDNCLDNIEAVF
jgi:hypothetical protein